MVDAIIYSPCFLAQTGDLSTSILVPIDGAGRTADVRRNSSPPYAAPVTTDRECRRSSFVGGITSAVLGLTDASGCAFGP